MIPAILFIFLVFVFRLIRNIFFFQTPLIIKKGVLGQFNFFMPNSSIHHPLFLIPSYKDYLWGGQQIVNIFNRNVELSICAESWEVSDRHEGHSYIKNGEHQGRALKELIDEKPFLFGFKKFPLLIKLIDAADILSIQVHPSVGAAKKYGGEPKSEMWHILEAEEGAQIYLGLNQNLSPKEILQAIERGNLKDFMHAMHVKKGETYFIPGGLIHSIGKGCLIYEVQQNSNTTYRLHDWGRLDKTGKGRELHIEDALKVINPSQKYVDELIDKPIFNQEGLRYQKLIQSDFFTFNKLFLEKAFSLPSSDICRIYFVMGGDLMIKSHRENFMVLKGSSFIVPRSVEGLQLTPLGINVEVLETIPSFEKPI